MAEDVTAGVAGVPPVDLRPPQGVPSDASFFPPMDMAPVRGRVIEASTGLPLAGVLVHWVVALGSDAYAMSRATELGRACSGEDGTFEITLAAANDAQQAACGLAWRRDTKSYFVLGETYGRGGQTAEPVDVRSAKESRIRVRGGDDPDVAAWRTLSAYLASNRMYRTEELSRQLSAPYVDSPTAAWPVPQRAAVLATIGRSFGDDDARPLLEQEHLLNLDALAKGDVVKAVNNYRSVDLYEQFGGMASEWYGGSYFQLPKSDRELYRDYLRGAWVTAARRMHGAGPADSALELQIDLRFHQNFHVSDVKPQPVHKLLVPILRSVLTTRADHEGFGIAPAAIPAQGMLTDVEFVAKLIAMTKESATELRNRFRVRFERAAGEQVSPIDLNIEALQGLLADTYQSPEEPFPTTLRGVEPEKPLLFAPWVGRAPFFLEYEEWLDRQRRFYPENVYDIRRTLPAFLKDYRDAIVAQKTASHTKIGAENSYFASEADWRASAAWVERVIVITDTIRTALASAEKQVYGDALGLLDAATNQIRDARKARNGSWQTGDFLWFHDTGNWNDFADRRAALKTRAARPVTKADQLAAFEAFFDPNFAPHVFAFENGPGPHFWDWLESWLARARTLYTNELTYFEHVLIPYFRANILATMGDHAGAIRWLGTITGYDVGIARTTDAAGYPFDSPKFYRSDALPYTTGVVFDPDTRWYDDQRPNSTLSPNQDGNAVLISDGERPLIAPFEHRFFKLAQGDEMLAWADELYRTDEPSAIRRARELYKGVIFMHGEDAGIAPHFKDPNLHPALFPLGGGDLFPLTPVGQEQNPARMSQLARARAAYWQIDQGLNVYGYHADMVPVLRYRPLKQSADLFATSAKSAQTDFLQYQTRFESALIEGWQTAAMVKKAEASAGIANEQIEIAKSGVAKAQEQVAIVKAQIEAKKKEIADADSFFGQAKDFFGGIKDSLKGMVPLAEKAGNDQSPAGGSPTTDQLLALAGKSTQGASASSEATAAALGSGAALTLGFAAFAYYGYTTMSGMADAMARRDGELKSLETVSLAAAEAQVKLKERDVTIANYTKQIAQTELDLARALDRYQRDRFLNVDLWNKLATFAQRTMRRYIELGARWAWFAERALAFEQNREIHIIRLNYVQSALRALTGPDRLLLDLAELEANRLQGVRLTAPVKQTLSLARDFPVAFGQLKKTGRCSIHTMERQLQDAYPGTFGYRLRAVTVAALDADGPPPRGVLRNLGASLISNETGATPKVLVRFPDALPLSEFRLHADMWVYGLPGETLLQFEGSGFETDWELEFPLAANPKGLRSLSDVMITCDMNALYSQTLAMQQAALPPAPVARSIALAASVWDPNGVATLHAKVGPVQIRFDLTKLTLPVQEKNRTISNLALLVVGKTEQVYSATLLADGSGVQPAFNITDGLALSNDGPLLGAGVAMPLNDLVALPLVQAFVLEIDRAGVVDELAALNDVVLYMEYTADLK